MKNWTKIKSKNGLIFWRDNKTGLLWAPPLKEKYEFNAANALTQKQLSAELGEGKWAIPTREEIYEALAHGLLDLEPKHGGIFWSASVGSVSRSFAWGFDSYGDISFSYRFSVMGVRCVGR